MHPDGDRKRRYGAYIRIYFIEIVVCLVLGQKIRVALRNVSFDRLPVYLLVKWRCEFCLK